MQQVFDHMLQQRPLLHRGQFLKPGRIDRQKRDAVPHRYSGALSVKRPLLAAQIEDEVPVEGAFTQQPYYGVLQALCRSCLLRNGPDGVKHDAVVLVLRDACGNLGDL